MERNLEQYVKEHFPDVKPGVRPFGLDVLVQMKLFREKTASGLVLVKDTQEMNNENTMVARVVAIGPLAYRNRDTGEPWNEGIWARPGDLVLVPKWGGFRFDKRVDVGTVRFAIFKDLELQGGLDADSDLLDLIQ